MELSGHIEPRPGAAAEQGASGNEVSSSPSSAITAVFLQLLPRVAGFMPRTAWILRLLCKSAAATLRGPQHTTVHLSEPAPPAEFRWRWCGPQSLRSTTFEQRKQLELLTARSGVVANLEALAARGDLSLLSRPPLEWGPLLDAAAGAGRLEACLWLHEQRGVPLTWTSQEAAAAGDSVDVCEWLLARGLQWADIAVWSAARQGHVRLVERLLQLRPQAARVGKTHALELLKEAAHGCDLATLQRLHAEHVASRGLGLRRSAGGGCLAAAAGSPTPDWAAKMEWLEGLGCPRDTPQACVGAARCKGDGAARLAWLTARGYPLDVDPVWATVQACNAEALRYLLARGVQLEPADLSSLVYDACTSGCLEVLQLLWNEGVLPSAYLIQDAAFHGHLHIVAWAAEQLGERAELTADLSWAAARSGSMPLLRWLHERGCPRDASAFAGAAQAGSEEALDWLLERGCPMGEDGAAYVAAAAHYDLPTLRCLARLGCPFAPDGGTLTRAAYEVGLKPPFDPRPLQWLLGAGCPVDWDAAVRDTCAKRQELNTDGKTYEALLGWLEQQRQHGP